MPLVNNLGWIGTDQNVFTNFSYVFQRFQTSIPLFKPLSSEDNSESGLENVFLVQNLFISKGTTIRKPCKVFLQKINS